MKVKAREREAVHRLPAHTARARQHPHLHQWFRVLMATFLICVSLGVGSIAGVLAQTFVPHEKWVKVPIKDPVTGEEMKDPVTGEVQYTLVKSDESEQGLVNPWEVISPFNNLDRRINILLLGSDYNYYRGKRLTEAESGIRSRTDTIMLASLDPVSRRVNILSIPRDTRVLIPGHHYDKVNAAMTYGGVDLVKKTVTELTGVPIDYYMALKVDGLVNTVDILGGIRIYVEKDMKYQDDTAHLGINIHKGWKERMNGEQAHGYIRFRHDELGDIGRVQRQQKFIHAVTEKLLQPESWLKFPALMQHMNENIETDMPQDVIGQLIKFGTSLKKDDLHMAMLPGTFYNPGGISYWAMDPYMARSVITDLFPDSSLAQSPDPTAPSPSGSVNPISRYRVTVWNATTDLQVGREVVRRLREAGWNIYTVYKAPAGAPRTRFIAQTGKSELLPQLAAAVGFPRGESLTASIGDIASDFTVLIEQDLVSFYRHTMSPEDWNRAERAPVPGTAAGYRQRGYQPPAQLPVTRAPVQQPLRTRQAAPIQQAAPVQQTAPATQPVNTAPANLPPETGTARTSTEIQPQLPSTAEGAPAGDSQPRDPLYD